MCIITATVGSYFWSQSFLRAPAFHRERKVARGPVAHEMISPITQSSVSHNALIPPNRVSQSRSGGERRKGGRKEGRCPPHFSESFGGGGRWGGGAEGNASLMESTAVHTDTQALGARTHTFIHPRTKKGRHELEGRGVVVVCVWMGGGWGGEQV